MNECTERNGIFFCFILFICLQLFILTLAKINVPKLNLELVLTTILQKSVERSHPIRYTVPVLIGVRDSSTCDSRKYFTIQMTAVDCDANY